MGIQTSGSISVQDIVDEFGGTAPHSLNEYYRNGDNVPGNNTNVPESGPISFDDFYGAVNEVQHTPSNNDTNLNLQTIFGSNWASSVPKRLIVPSGVTVGATSGYAIWAPTGMSGTLVMDISGSVQGYGGASNGGWGGSAIGCDQTAGVTINLNSGGEILAGGGGGGQGGAGGTGGQGGTGGTGGQGRRGNATYSGGSGGAGGAGGSGGAGGAGGVGQGYNQSAGSGSAGASGSGGSGGAAGFNPTPASQLGTHAEGVGSMYDHPSWGGTGGTGGTGGAGGQGGTGGAGGSFGNSGSQGNTGNTGLTGNQGNTGGNGDCQNYNACSIFISIGYYNGSAGSGGSSGSAGSAGSAGGLAGEYIYNRASITFNNNGTVAGR